jgi:hypothetical protein
MGVSKRTRFEVFKRDKFTCQYCGRSAPEVILHCDHITPKAAGGEDDILNLVTSCSDCNLGKGPVELADDAAIIKRKQQLDELQERRAQLEMMMEWQRELANIDDETVEQLIEYWQSLTGYAITKTGRDRLNRLRRRTPLPEILECMRLSVETYLKYNEEDDPDRPTFDSAEKAFDYISRIAGARKRDKDKPWMKDLYYIRGILRNRLSYVNEHKAIELMVAYVENGGDIEDLRTMALQIKNWTEFRGFVEGEITE